VDFLNETVADLKLPTKVIRGKAESVKTTFDYVTARAVAPLDRLIASTWHLIKPGGSLLAMKGESAQAEIDQTTLPKGAECKLHEVKLGDIPISRIVEVVKVR
jgi:16S rRNA (guanine527-N7)-methyltransferase